MQQDSPSALAQCACFYLEHHVSGQASSPPLRGNVQRYDVGPQLRCNTLYMCNDEPDHFAAILRDQRHGISIACKKTHSVAIESKLFGKTNLIEKKDRLQIVRPILAKAIHPGSIVISFERGPKKHQSPSQ